MSHKLIYVCSVVLLSLITTPAFQLSAESPKDTDMPDWNTVVRAATSTFIPTEDPDSVAAQKLMDRIEATRILAGIDAKPLPKGYANGIMAPLVFRGYRSLSNPLEYALLPTESLEAKIFNRLHLEHLAQESLSRDSLILAEYGIFTPVTLAPDAPSRNELPVAFGNAIRKSLRNAIRYHHMQEDLIYSFMIANPQYIQYANWDLPIPPSLPEEDYSFLGFLKRLHLPDVNVNDAVISTGTINPINWLHTLNVAIQFSQAYLSPNWYQGGNNYLAFLGQFLWDLQLNQVFHPNWMFHSTVSYKLALNSTSDDPYHKYAISQDLFQYNLKTGYKAAHNWFYTFATQFKTQFLNNYASNSPVRTASFLSPGELNLGLGMTYNKQNAKKSVTFSASISPLSYNLKTCVDALVDHSQFGIPQDVRYLNEYGSNAEVTFLWNPLDNISYSTRLFIFSDYKSFTGDWENTLNFRFSKFFSTQLYAHLRYDSSANPLLFPQWKKWMIKEILSVGLSYTFSTK